jgi:hypothetical protein
MEEKMQRKVLGFIALMAGLAFISCSSPTATSTSNDAKSANATLGNLSVSSGTLSPAFSPDIKSYTLSVTNAVSSVTINGTAADGKASVSPPVTLSSLVVGVSQTARITVTAESGETLTYSVTVTRAADTGENVKLSSLSLSTGNLDPSFSATTHNYSVSVANDVSSMTLYASAADASATVSYSPGKTQALSVGNNTFTITVTSQTGYTYDDYMVTVIRAGSSASSNAELSSLSLNSGSLSPSFSASTTSYTASVANDVSSITLTASAADALASVAYSPAKTSSLSVGANNFTVTVTAQDGTTKYYYVTVTRADVSTSYTNLPASADGTWSYGGVTVFTISNSQMDYSGLTGLTLQYDASGNLYYVYSGNKIALTGYTWDGSVIRVSGVALTKGSANTGSYTNLPASADGTWSYGGVTVFTISNSQMDYSGLTGLTLQYDASGNLYYVYSGNKVALTGYTWDGSVIRVSGVALTKGSASTGSYTNLPSSANGTWSLYGSPIFTISNSQMNYSGLTGLTLQYDASGNLYYVYSGTRIALTGYTWDGSVIKVSGVALTKS